MFDLTGMTALVTGASGGIGSAIAQALAAQGARLAVSGSNADKLNAFRDSLGGDHVALPCNLGDAAAVDALVPSAVDALGGKLDILVNNVGHLRRGRPEELAYDDLDFTLRTGVLASFSCAQEAARRMIASGHGGSIINISSIAGASALGRGNFTHSANKGAVNQMTKELAVEWAHYGIRVNAILPCQVLTEGFKTWMASDTFADALHERMLGGIPMNRMATPEEIAGPVVFLASDAAAMVTGTLLAVDGGNLALNAGGSHTW